MVDEKAVISDAGHENVSLKQWLIVVFILVIIVASSLSLIKNPIHARAAVIAGVCLTLWLSEVVQPYVPTFVLWAITPLLLQPLATEFRFAKVLGWAADPVLALFLGGFVLSVAASRYGLDAQVAHLALKFSRGNRLSLLFLTAAATAGLSMWMSNIAAAAMMIAALRPIFANVEKADTFRRALLMSIAIGANFGGMATPIGTGPNAIAIAAVSKQQPLTFVSWMTFALPLTVGMIVAGVLLLALRFKVKGNAELHSVQSQPFGKETKAVVIIFCLTIAAWLSEPLHGAPSATIALISAAVLFGSGLLSRRNLNQVDWSTLALIAGGISLGNLLEQSGLVKSVAATVPWSALHPFLRLLTLCLASALMSALMSNTATATMLIPLAGSLDPNPSVAILIAIAASTGIPFVISTPPNAMVYGEGGVKSSDLLIPGVILMILGCLLIALTGGYVLSLMGIH
jgi:sodium-dependent dicarboxylate transporter 2/3/5